MERWIEFLVLGKPQPAGSKRALPIKRRDGTTTHVVVDANRHAASWKQEVRTAASQAYDGPLLVDPLEVCLTFVRVRPKSHYRSGRNAHLLKDDAPRCPTGKPDVLKLARAVEDALTGVLYRDDALTVSLTAEKRWGDRECVIVRVRREDDHERAEDLRQLPYALGRN